MEQLGLKAYDSESEGEDSAKSVSHTSFVALADEALSTVGAVEKVVVSSIERNEMDVSNCTIEVTSNVGRDEILDTSTKTTKLRFIHEIPECDTKKSVNQYLIDTITSQLEAKRSHGFDLTEVRLKIYLVSYSLKAS